MQGKMGHAGTGAGRWRPLGVGDWKTSAGCVRKVAKMVDATVWKTAFRGRVRKGAGRSWGAEPKGMGVGGAETGGGAGTLRREEAGRA